MTNKNTNFVGQKKSKSSAEREFPAKSIEDSENGQDNSVARDTHYRTEQHQDTDTASAIGGWMIALLWLMALGAGTYALQNWMDKRDSARQGTTISGAQGQSLRVASDRFGQFAVAGNANGQKVSFLVDTGASGISIPQGIADQLELRRGQAFPVNTANGVITVYSTVIDTLNIGPHSQKQVQAHINPSMEGELALLGMSFLRRYELIQREGVLWIK